MKIAIHQPNFFPWYPFFQKMLSADVFIILGNCQFEKNNYQNRFHIEEKWYTMSVNSGSKDKIVEKRYVNYERDWARIKAQLVSYDCSRFDSCISGDLYQTNIRIIREIASILGFRGEILEDKPVSSNGTARLIELVQQFPSPTYLSGTGAKAYLDESLFREYGIGVEYQGCPDVDKVPILQYLHNKGL